MNNCCLLNSYVPKILVLLSVDSFLRTGYQNSDANPRPLFLIPGFGISQCPILGLKMIFCVRNYQCKNNIIEDFLFACLPYANNWISNLWRVLFVSMFREVKS